MKTIKVECENCGIEFERLIWEFRRSRNHFCSHKCYYKWRRTKAPRKRWIHLNCEWCKKPISKFYCHYKRVEHHFCSKGCATEFKRAKAQKVLICRNCGQKFKARLSDKIAFCSKKCKIEYSSNGLFLDAFQLGYLSGFIDGDGSLGFYKGKRASCRRGFHWIPLVQLSNTDLHLIEQIRKMLPNGHIKTRSYHNRPNEVPTHNLVISGSNPIYTILSQIKLIRKERQRVLLMEACELVREHHSGYTPHDERLEEIYQEMKKLNKRGTPEKVKLENQNRNLEAIK